MLKLKFHAKTYYPLICLFILFFLIPPDLNGQERQKNHLKTVVIDAGHGGKDPGACGNYKDEKDLVLSIALKVGKHIEENFPNVKVIYTRKTDTLIPLFERAKIANKNKADLFISIHVNANGDSKIRGTETYVMGLHKSKSNLEVAKQENSAILYEEDYSKTYQGFDPNSAESYIIFSLMQNAYLKQSLNFASYIQKNFNQNTNLKNRGVKQAGFLVLYKTSMPRVLVEAGYLSNPREEKYLNKQEAQTNIAESIYEAFREYKQKVESESVMLTNQKDTSAAQDSIHFKVQVAASSDPIPMDSDFFSGHENVEEHHLSNQYKYTIGNTSNYEKIQQLKQKLKKDFPGAFIVAFVNNEPVSLDKALSIQNNH
ncbi:MAG: N-acetylmuramoyl-L-alanine amidase [Bacteroidales bacterium]|nr:N-acetylmuramoyl-L-alanine amidase [Bacteroidales bacterium]